jgi:hypothetical protein
MDHYYCFLRSSLCSIIITIDVGIINCYTIDDHYFASLYNENLSFRFDFLSALIMILFLEFILIKVIEFVHFLLFFVFYQQSFISLELFVELICYLMVHFFI